MFSRLTFVNDKGQRDTYQYVKSGNGQIAHINGIMSELIYLSDIRQKIISAKKIESLTLQSVTVRCGERSATFFIDPALTSDECLQVEQMLTSPSVRIPYGSDVALYDTDFDALIPILITDFTSEPTPTKSSTRLSSLGDLLRTAQRSLFPNRPTFSTTNTIPLSPDGSLDTHINRSHNAKLRRPSRYFFGKAEAFCFQQNDNRVVIGLWPLS